jgi:hypothetical protein
VDILIDVTGQRFTRFVGTMGSEVTKTSSMSGSGVARSLSNSARHARAARAGLQAVGGEGLPEGHQHRRHEHRAARHANRDGGAEDVGRIVRVPLVEPFGKHDQSSWPMKAS